MSGFPTLPSKSLMILDDSLCPANAAHVAASWIGQPEEIFQLSPSERTALFELIRTIRPANVAMKLMNEARRAIMEGYERQPEVMAVRAEATAIVDRALADPAALCDLPRREWRALLSVAWETGDSTAPHRLEVARNAVRDNHPDLIAAYDEVEGTLTHPAAILALNRTQWSELLRAADRVSYGFQGQYRNYRAELRAAKTEAVIARRLDQIPLSETQHLGIYGSSGPDLEAKIEAVIQTNWFTVPRLWVAHNRKEMSYSNGVPNAQIYPCDTPEGPFYGVPRGAEITGTTSIICDMKSAAKLKMMGLTAFNASVDPQLEAYFRSLMPFPWEQGMDGGGS